MSVSILKSIVIACLLVAFCPTTHADLIVQDDDTVLDTDRNIYWLQDANLPTREQFGLSCSYINCLSGGMTW